MILNTLTANSPVDGRYRNKVDKLEEFFSEFALIRYRVKIEVEYFVALCNLPLPQLSRVTPEQKELLRVLAGSFSMEDAQRVKEIEKVTNRKVFLSLRVKVRRNWRDDEQVLKGFGF